MSTSHIGLPSLPQGHRISQSFEVQRRVRRAAAADQAPAATAVVAPPPSGGEGGVAGGDHAVLEHEVWSPGVHLFDL